MQKVFSIGKMPDAPVGGVFLRRDPASRPGRVCGFLGGNLLHFGSEATRLIDLDTISGAEVGA